ncbi:MAG: hypothetical protein ABWW65_07275 [Thermoprotei archaeon]
MLSKGNLRIIERYNFLGITRYRIYVVGTNIVFNVQAHSDEEAIEKALELAKKMGLTDEVVEAIKEKIKQSK